jgi:tetratricopeptide (TPR) repeat protein
LKEGEKYSAPDVIVAFAELYKEMGKHDSAVYYYEKALQKTPNNGKLSRQAGTANFLAKNYNRAIELLEKDVKGVNDPNFKMQLPVNWKGSEHLELALSYDVLKNNQEASKNYVAALKYQQPEYQKILKETDSYKTEYQKLRN